RSSDLMRRTRWASWGLSPPFGPNAVARTGVSGCAGWAAAGDGAPEWLALGTGAGAAADWLACAAGPGRVCPAFSGVAACSLAADGAAGDEPARRRSATKPATTTASAPPPNPAHPT